MSLAILTFGTILTAQGPQTRRGISDQMSGTYELETTRGDDPQRSAQTATRSLPPGQRERAYRSLLSRLEPPQTLAIDRNGRAITIASSRGPRTEFDADGQTRTERGPNGQMTRTRTEISGNRLTVSTNGGSRGSDFSVTFETSNRGANLLVTRRLDDDDLPRQVTMQSWYRRTVNSPRWDIYAPESRYGPVDGGSPRYPVNAGRMAVADGTRILATLDTPLSMRSSRNGDRFAMTVRNPDEFRGARIEGVISRVDARRRGGNAEDMRIDFQTIQFGGRSTDFDAVLSTVRLSDGSLLYVDGEGDVQGGNHGETTVRNGAIGAALGAIIGAIAGGGKGAAIGAVAGGAGGVILSQGHEQLDLAPGSEVTLTSVVRSRTP
jgi:hypothetical protein